MIRQILAYLVILISCVAYFYLNTPLSQPNLPRGAYQIALGPTALPREIWTIASPESVWLHTAEWDVTIDELDLTRDRFRGTWQFPTEFTPVRNGSPWGHFVLSGGEEVPGLCHEMQSKTAPAGHHLVRTFSIYVSPELREPAGQYLEIFTRSEGEILRRTAGPFPQGVHSVIPLANGQYVAKRMDWTQDLGECVVFDSDYQEIFATPCASSAQITVMGDESRCYTFAAETYTPMEIDLRTFEVALHPWAEGSELPNPGSNGGWSEFTSADQGKTLHTALDNWDTDEVWLIEVDTESRTSRVLETMNGVLPTTQSINERYLYLEIMGGGTNVIFDRETGKSEELEGRWDFDDISRTSMIPMELPITRADVTCTLPNQYIEVMSDFGRTDEEVEALLN